MGALAWLLSARGRPRPEWAPHVALAALLVPTFVDHTRRMEPGDSVHYYTYLRSALLDGDLRLENDYEAMAFPVAIHHAAGVLPIGAPLLWSPLVVPVHLVRQAARLLGAGPPSGVEPAYQATAAFATLVYGAAGLFVLMAALRRWVAPWPAFWATVLVWVGTPLRFYLSVLPGMAHGIEFFGAALALLFTLRLRDRPDWRRAVPAGIGCGIAFLARSQDGLLLAFPAVLLAQAWLRAEAGERRAVLSAGAALAGAFLVTALPQLIVWQVMYGRPFLVPHASLHGQQFLQPADPQLLGTLVSERGGLLPSHPVTLVALLGLVALFLRDRLYVAAAAPVLLAMWWLNASVFDWYHVRRYTGIVPLLAPGLALVLAPLARVPVLAALLALLAWRYDVAVDALRGAPGDPAPVRAVLGEARDAALAAAYTVVEPLAPGAAATMLAQVSRAPVLAAGSTRIVLGERDTRLRLPLRARNLSEPAVEDGVACRWVRGDEARLFLPAPWEGPAVVEIEARPRDGAAMEMELEWDGHALGTRPLAPGWQRHRFLVPRVRPGTNVLVVRARAAGDRPREVRRSMAVAAIQVSRQE